MCYFSVYTETENQYVPGLAGLHIPLLPPVTLYKEYINLISKKGDQVIMSEEFVTEHQKIFWNIILWFKIVKLPRFMVDCDFGPHH